MRAQRAERGAGARDNAELRSWREGARRLARRLTWPHVAEDYIQGYLQALGADTEAV